jgi:RNA polymerase sigma factor (sigma-70 family)
MSTTRRYPDRLPADAELRLARRVEAGLIAAAMLDPDDPTPQTVPTADLTALVAEGEQAKEVIITTHLSLVRRIATEAARYTSLDRADLFQEGCLALGAALMRYDHRRGAFAPFAAKCVRLCLRDLAGAQNRTAVNESLDAAFNIGGLPFDVDHTGDALKRILLSMPLTERRVIGLRHGWDTGQPATLVQVADTLNLSIRSVRRLERDGIVFLRRHWLHDGV